MLCFLCYIIGAVLSEYSVFTSGLRKGHGSVNELDTATKVAQNLEFFHRLLTFRSWKVLGYLQILSHQKLQLLDPELIRFYENHIEVTLQQSIEIANSNQGNSQWFSERKKRLTASKARSQYSYYANPNANWDKRYKELYHSTFTGNEDTLRGLRCEDPAREIYEDMFKCQVVQSGLLVRPELPWLAASLDGIVVDNNGRFLRNIEIKTVKEGLRLTASELVEMKAIKTFDEHGQLKKTTDHYAQVQIGMLLSGIDECDYLVYSEKGKDFVLKRVLFDEQYVYDLTAKLVNVYFEIFLPKIMLDQIQKEKE